MRPQLSQHSCHRGASLRTLLVSIPTLSSSSHSGLSVLDCCGACASRTVRTAGSACRSAVAASSGPSMAPQLESSLMRWTSRSLVHALRGASAAEGEGREGRRASGWKGVMAECEGGACEG